MEERVFGSKTFGASQHFEEEDSDSELSGGNFSNDDDSEIDEFDNTNFLKKALNELDDPSGVFEAEILDQNQDHEMYFQKEDVGNLHSFQFGSDDDSELTSNLTSESESENESENQNQDQNQNQNQNQKDDIEFEIGNDTEIGSANENENENKKKIETEKEKEKEKEIEENIEFEIEMGTELNDEFQNEEQNANQNENQTEEINIFDLKNKKQRSLIDFDSESIFENPERFNQSSILSSLKINRTEQEETSTSDAKSLQNLISSLRNPQEDSMAKSTDDDETNLNQHLSQRLSLDEDEQESLEQEIDFHFDDTPPQKSNERSNDNMLFSSSVFPQMNPNKQINLDTNLFDLNESKLFSKTEGPFSQDSQNMEELNFEFEISTFTEHTSQILRRHGEEFQNKFPMVQEQEILTSTPKKIGQSSLSYPQLDTLSLNQELQETILHLRNYMNGKLENKELTVIIERCSKALENDSMKSKKIDELQKKINELNKESNSTLQTLKNLENQILQFEQYNKKFQEQLSKYEEQLAQGRERELNQKQEIEKLNKQIMSGIEKTQESQSFHLTQFQSQIDNLQRLLQSKEKMIENIEVEKENSIGKVKAQFHKTVENLENEIKEKKNECDTLQWKIQELHEKISNQNESETQKREQLLELKKKMEIEHENEIAELKESMREHYEKEMRETYQKSKSEFEQSRQMDLNQIEKLESSLKDKDSQIKELKTTLNQSIMTAVIATKNDDSKENEKVLLEKARHELEDFKTEFAKKEADFEKQCLILDERSKELETKKTFLTQEIQRLQTELQKKQESARKELIQKTQELMEVEQRVNGMKEQHQKEIESIKIIMQIDHSKLLENRLKERDKQHSISIAKFKEQSKRVFETALSQVKTEYLIYEKQLIEKFAKEKQDYTEKMLQLHKIDKENALNSLRREYEGFLERRGQKSYFLPPTLHSHSDSDTTQERIQQIISDFNSNINL